LSEERIWAPWRLAYVKEAGKNPDEECIFCAKPAAGDDEGSLIVHRGEKAFVILNKYPYTSGHLMVAPFEHVGRLEEIAPATVAEIMELVQQSVRLLESTYGPEGYNMGINQGRAAGAGVEHHIHFHVVPRWGGDTNFMSSVGESRVIPQSLEDTYGALRGGFS
jgi:ATP adenylyltransferase